MPSGCVKIRRSPECSRRRKFGNSNPASAMHRQQLEHIIRAAAGITGATEFVIVGSQAVLGQFPQAPDELLVSIEADVFSLRDPADSDLIDGSIGEGSPFHQTFGYYAQGVSLETAILPTGWRDRLVPVHNQNTGGGTWLCLEIHDLAVSKLVAGREKDLDFVGGLLRHHMVQTPILRERLANTALTPECLQACFARLERLVAAKPASSA